MNRLNKEDFVPFAPDPGVQERVSHIGCPAGTDTKRRLYILTTEEGNILAHCHHCGLSGYSGVGRMSAASVRKKLSPQETDQVVVGDLGWPEDTNWAPWEWPAKAVAWLYKYHFTDNMIQTADIGYSPSQERVIVSAQARNGRLDAYQARALDGREPKYLTTRRADVQHPVAWHWIDNDIVVVCEDILSATRVSHAGFDSVALLGTFLDDHTKKELLAYPTVLIFMDPDKAGKDAARKIKQSLDLVHSNVHIISSEVQPKELSNEKLKTLLDGFRTSATPKK
jgi:5S rRNA maturation endonuclease (ribonuclease M5)